MQMSRLQLRLLDHPCRHRALALCPGRSGLRAVCLPKGFGTVASPGKLKLTWAMCCIMNVVQPIVLGAAETSPTIFPSPLLSGSEIRAKWNAVSLAFIGDSVWEVRRPCFCPAYDCFSYQPLVATAAAIHTTTALSPATEAGPVLQCSHS